MYSPVIKADHIRPLYRLARVRGVPMTRLVNEAVAALLASGADEIARYVPAVHDRQPHRRADDRTQIDRLAA